MYGVSAKGLVLSDYVILSNIVATILVVAVTIQVCILVLQSSRGVFLKTFFERYFINPIILFFIIYR